MANDSKKPLTALNRNVEARYTGQIDHETFSARQRTTKAKGGSAKAPRLHNQLYRAEVGRTPAGSPILKLRATNSTDRYARHRQLAAFIYELAAAMERRSDDLGARWVISPDATNGRVVIELAADHETTLADEFVASVIADNDLA